MIRPLGLIHGHYECRSLNETVPVFIDLLALEVVEKGHRQVIVKHPNTDWHLVVHEAGSDAADKPVMNHYGSGCRARKKWIELGDILASTRTNIALAKSPSRGRPISLIPFILRSPAATTGRSNAIFPRHSPSLLSMRHTGRTRGLRIDSPIKAMFPKV